MALPDRDVKRGRAVDMVLDARYPSPKIDILPNPPHAGIIFVNWNDTTGLAAGNIKLLYSFPHGYGYVPTAFASYRFDNGSNILRGTLPFQNASIGEIIIDTDEINVNVKYYSFDQNVVPLAIGPFTMQIRFYVMSEHG